MKRKGLTIIYAFLFIFMAACVTPQSRMKELAPRYPHWDRETLEKVSRGLIETGMTKEQVSESLASMPRYYPYTEGDRWSYVEDIIHGRRNIIEFGKILLFRDDHLVEIRDFQRIPNLLYYDEYNPKH